ncbi:hypothetical protein Gdia_0544 [Gluconacetobacter diazotrophicus PA1 5]|uniref:VapE domain-containing protein n=1 Tax=Gluconacetobacter diazotrophicus TaxID=33996 RepID=UPI000181EFA9|nr:VapE domain-containing protein [Gluconacetobacter diazotrophicus]ACI50338.1 hypothetical protein Gdia_0544 [Gluconacetobacter diazotrophicus PA1 5]
MMEDNLTPPQDDKDSKKKFNFETVNRYIDLIEQGKMEIDDAVISAFTMMSDDIQKVSVVFKKSGCVSAGDIKRCLKTFLKQQTSFAVIEFYGVEDFVKKYMEKFKLKFNEHKNIEDDSFNESIEKMKREIAEKGDPHHAIERNMIMERQLKHISHKDISDYITDMNNYVLDNGLSKRIGGKQNIIDTVNKIRNDVDRERKNNIINYLIYGYDTGNRDLEGFQKFIERGSEMLDESHKHISFTFDRLKKAAEIISDDDSTYVATVLYHFIWQVKRKMTGRQVDHHMMPIFTGKQGLGKSQFISASLLKPIDSLWSQVSFGIIEEEKSFEIYNNYVLFLDEMGGVRKADVENIKNVISAPTRTGRPMRTNDSITVRNNVVFIGASNKTLDDLIKDDTGARRFPTITYGKNNLAPYMNPDFKNIDWEQIWLGVNEAAPCLFEMYKELKELVIGKIEEVRYVGPFEEWAFREETVRDFGMNGAVGNKAYKTATALYENFKTFMDTCHPRAFQMSQRAFSIQLKKTATDNPDKISHKIIEKQSMYCWL